jgi:hypothetical protein
MPTDPIRDLLDIATKIRDIAADHDGITWESAFSHPAVVGLRDDLLALLGAADTASAMIAGVETLNAEWDRMHAVVPLDVAACGVVAAAARSLSYAAVAKAGEPLQLFVFTMRELLPWLERALQLGVALVAAVV